jgi:hypothetical protein
MLKHARAPQLFADGLDRSIFLQALCRDGLVPRRFVEKEVNDLENGDIPKHYGKPCQPCGRLTDSEVATAIDILRKSLLSARSG